MTKEEKQAIIVALLEERRGYEIHGNTDGLEQVDAELRRLGHEAKKPSERAERRPSGKQSSTR